jgi:hypothetical protein
MALHHFHWNGKERSVSISRHGNNTIALRLADDDLTTHGLDEIIVTKKAVELETNSTHATNDRTLEQEILQSVQAKVDLSSYFR